MTPQLHIAPLRGWALTALFKGFFAGEKRIIRQVVTFTSILLDSTLVEDRLFSNPDFYDKAYELLYEKYMDYTPGNIERAARELYESSKFSMEAYLEHKLDCFRKRIPY